MLLRGLAREQGHWGDFPAQLRRRLGDAAVHCLDLPGSGTERARPVPPSIAGFADDLRDRWLPLRCASAPGWGLMAVSLGGMVALDWIARHVGDFQRAVVINSSAGNLSPPWARMRWGKVSTVLRALTTQDPLAREQLILSAVSRTSSAEHTAMVAGRWADISRQRPLSRQAFLRQIAAATRFRAPEAVPVPLLVLGSAGDQLVDPACSISLARRYGAPLYMHPSAGHDLPLEAPAWVTQCVVDWLGSGKTKVGVRRRAE